MGGFLGNFKSTGTLCYVC